MKYFVKDISTGKIEQWTLAQVIEEINRDHSEHWQGYDESDWQEGWEEWCEGDTYNLTHELTIGQMVDLLTSDMPQENVGEYVETITTYSIYKKRKYTFKQILEAEMQSKADFERMLKEPMLGSLKG